MIEFFKDLANDDPVGFGTLLLALVALIQPHYLAWRRRKRGKLLILHSAGFEIGYSNLGPTIGLGGALAATQSQRIITDIQISLTRLRDNAQHNFRWLAFRGIQFSTDPADQKFQLPVCLVVGDHQSYPFNIIFNDTQSQHEMLPYLQAVGSAFNDILQSEAGDLDQTNDEHMEQDPSFMIRQKSLDELFHTSVYLDSYSRLNQIFYWQAGDYKIDIQAQTVEPSRIFTKTLNFRLSDNDVNQLRLNVVTMLQEHCGEKVIYNFAYPLAVE